jgi:hypothetical protein
LVQVWDWYFGEESDWIESHEYDFQTIVTHENGHAIGIEHSDDAASTMHAHLSPGVVRRAFSEHDVAALAVDRAGDDAQLLDLWSALRFDYRPAAGDTYLSAPQELIAKAIGRTIDASTPLDRAIEQLAVARLDGDRRERRAALDLILTQELLTPHRASNRSAAPGLAAQRPSRRETATLDEALLAILDESL